MPKPLSALTPAEAKRLRGVLFDLDDTLLDHRLLTQTAYDALWQLKAQGQHAIAVTGRAALWGKWLLELWPLDAIVTENGAIGWAREQGGIRRLDRLCDDERSQRWASLLQIVQRLRAEFDWLTPTGDEAQRLSDYTFDVGERVRVDPARTRLVCTRAAELGARSSVSSIHLHITLDAEDKASGSVRLLREVFQVDPAHAPRRYAFIGDSGNDAACFAAFETSIAVSNWQGQFSLPPRYVTTHPMGRGFAEAVALLEAKRRSYDDSHEPTAAQNHLIAALASAEKLR